MLVSPTTRLGFSMKDILHQPMRTAANIKATTCQFHPLKKFPSRPEARPHPHLLPESRTPPANMVNYRHGFIVTRPTHLRGVENGLDVFDYSLIIFLELRVCLHRLLQEQLDVPQLAEIEISLPLQARNSLLQLSVFLYQGR